MLSLTFGKLASKDASIHLVQNTPLHGKNITGRLLLPITIAQKG